MLAAFLFSTGGAAIKSCSLNAWQVGSLRSGIAAIALLAIFPEARRYWTSREHWTLRTLIAALAYAATLILFVAANKLTTSANAIFLQSTGPIYMLFLGPLILNERLRALDLFTVAAIGMGAALLFSGPSPTGITTPNPALGNALAAISGFTWALTITCLRLTGKENPDAETGAATVITGNFTAFLIALPMALPVVAIHGADLLVLLYLGIFQIGIAYLALTRGLKHVPGLESSTILLVEPVFNPLWSWIIHNERPGPATLAGGAVIILANLSAAWWQTRQRGSQTNAQSLT